MGTKGTKGDSKYYQHLKTKWSTRQKDLEKTLWQRHREHLEWVSRQAKNFAVGSLGSLILVASPAGAAAGQIATQAAHTDNQYLDVSKIDKNVFFISGLKKIVPDEMRPLTDSEEQQIGSMLSKKFNMKVSATLDGSRLNRSYGLIGAEQHLFRYPGDTVSEHALSYDDVKMYGGSGIAPGTGAWGYFAPSKSAFTNADEQRERYYIAVQTFLSPDFNQKVGKYRDFFRYRKMLVVNPNTGQAVVTDIADAGPAEFTGKHLGGSPEVMYYLGLADGPRKGAVLYFFIDDPNDQVKLGPVTI